MIYTNLKGCVENWTKMCRENKNTGRKEEKRQEGEKESLLRVCTKACCRNHSMREGVAKRKRSGTAGVCITRWQLAIRQQEKRVSHCPSNPGSWVSVSALCPLCMGPSHCTPPRSWLSQVSSLSVSWPYQNVKTMRQGEAMLYCVWKQPTVESLVCPSGSQLWGCQSRAMRLRPTQKLMATAQWNRDVEHLVISTRNQRSETGFKPDSFWS